MRQPAEAVDDRREARGVIDVRRPMQRDEHVLALLDAVTAPHGAVARRGLKSTQRVDHRVAHKAHPAHVDALPRQVVLRLPGCGSAAGRTGGR